MKQSKQAFKERVRKWAQKIGVEIHTISIRQMKSKWASFTKHSGLLIFNAELLAIEPAIGDYVIVHELLHSAVPNHGKLWKSLMRAYLGDYEGLGARLDKKERILTQEK
jgi:predicted metal-dependent hydrolase